MPENSNVLVRGFRKVARFVRLETSARRIYQRLTGRDPIARARAESAKLAALDQQAREVGGYVQYVMDIDPASRWFQREFVTQFGGFHPPEGNRTLTRNFPRDRVRSDFLLLLLRDITVRQVPGALAELGVHRGTSARVLHHYSPERKLYLFDTFSGFAPQDFASETVKLGFNQVPQFADTNVDVVLKEIAPANANVIPIPGWFPASVTAAVARETFALVHLDADLEAPIEAGLEFFWPKVASGGFVVVHDYNAWPGARLAVDRFRAKHRIAAVPMPDKTGSIVLAKI